MRDPDLGIADRFISDRPIDRPQSPADHLVNGVGIFLRDHRINPPITIAVTGRWGTGKTSFLHMVKEQLERFDVPVVLLNAFQHETEDDRLAALLETINDTVIPSWWRPRGVTFHGRLLWIRLSRSPTMMTTLAALVVFFIGFTIGFPSLQITELIAELMITVQLQVISLGDILSNLWRGLIDNAPVIAIVVTIVLALRKGRALSGEVGSAEVREKAGFRRRFIQDFKDIVKALRGKRVVVLVDDIDRCRPSHAIDVLLSVEFLKSAGNCFVILSMDRAGLERSISIHYQNLVEQLEEQQEPREATKSDFARRYLEKLVNVEVALPTPDEVYWNDYLTLISTQEFDKGGYRERVIRQVKAIAEASKKPLLWTVGALLVMGIGYGVGMKANMVTLADGSRASWDDSLLVLSMWLTVFAVLAGWLAYGFILERGVKIIHESPSWLDAINIWQGLIFRDDCSPGTLKRILNKINLFAAILRAEAREFKLPEPTLIALAIVENFDPSILEQQELLNPNSPKETVDQYRRSTRLANDDMFDEFRKISLAHELAFGHWPPTSEQLNYYKSLVS